MNDFYSKYDLTFIHHLHKIECTLKAYRNPMNNNILYAIEPQVAMYVSSKEHIESMVKDIKKMCTILSESGNLNKI